MSVHGLVGGAEFSPCRTYRYALWRWWNRAPGASMALFVGLNPSTADESNDDPTIRRCIRFAMSWGYDGIYMGNIFAYRATDPRVMKSVDDPVGPENDRWLRELSSRAGITVAAWGVHGAHRARGAQAVKLLERVHCLGTTKAGSPRHPLYLRSDCAPVPFGGA